MAYGDIISIESAERGDTGRHSGMFDSDQLVHKDY
jgi:hypothetical protein